MTMLNIMEILAKFLDCKLSIFETKTGKVLSLTVASIEKIGFIINYFNKYPLFSSKYLDYEDWKQVVLLILDNKHYTEEGLSKTDFLKKRMNRQRIHFSWDHLNRLSI